MVGLHLLVPGVQLLTRPWVFLGLIPLLGGVAINLLADRAFKQQGTTVKPFEESSCLITTGIFCVSRNPMYLGFALGLAGIAVLLGSLTPWLVLPAFVVVIDSRFIRAEEAMLEQQFGDSFRHYKHTTRRWI